MQQYGKFNERAHGIFLLSVVSALYLKTNESTADTRGQSQVHCTRQGSTADAKEPLGLKRNPPQRNFRSHMAEAHAREYQEEYARQNPSAVSIVLVLPPLSFCKNNQEKRVMPAGNRVRKMWCACKNAAKRETDVDDLTLAQNLSQT